MKLLLTIISSFFLSLIWSDANAQDYNQYIQKGLEFEKVKNEKAALLQYRKAQELKPTDLTALYKCSELFCRIGARESDHQIRDNHYKSGLAFATMAFKYHPKTDDACVAMSIALGRIALTKSGKEKVTAVREIKSFAENAITINPLNFKAWHIIGKWNYEVSNLNFIEKAAIRIIYGGLPDASFSKAISAYEKANELNPNFGLNYLELAKAYEKEGKKDNAITTLKKVLLLPDYNEDDPIVKKQAGSMLLRLE